MNVVKHIATRTQCLQNLYQRACER